MSDRSSLLRRGVTAASIVTLTVAALSGPTASATADAGTAIRPFKAHVSAAALADLRRRLAATRWPDKETVADRSQGVPLDRLQALVQYWGKDYDWRKAEARFNAIPQYVTTIDGVDIQFAVIKSKAPNAMPLIMTHGWPGSFFEFSRVIDPLTNPAAHGGRAEDAFDLVLPTIPGFGFSGKPTKPGWDPDHVARVWAELMQRLGYTRYVAQGGDWGSPISTAMARQNAPGLLGIHLNLPATVPPEIGAALQGGGPAPAGITDKERAVFDALRAYGKSGSSAYFTMLTARPQAVGYGLNDSPAGLAAWILVHPGFSHWSFGDDAEKSPTKDEVLDDITFYWLTNSAASSGRIYWENAGRNITSAVAEKTTDISLPVAITVFPEDVYKPPETWARRAFKNLVYFHEVDKGGHFAAWEQPELFSSELRNAFRPLRQQLVATRTAKGERP
jgi:pimeloyl-ACP methyl ester carboxylesterase